MFQSRKTTKEIFFENFTFIVQKNEAIEGFLKRESLNQKEAITLDDYYKKQMKLKEIPAGSDDIHPMPGFLPKSHISISK